jgi:hypothetical protein
MALLLLPSAGVARAEPVPTVPPASTTPAQVAADTYAANAFLIVHVGKQGDTVDEKGSTWRPLRGLIYRFSLEPPEFLDAVGRSDLAAHERTRHGTARALSIGGDVVATVGILTAVWGLGISGGRLALAGLAGAIGGVVVHEAGESMLKPALPESEALRLADSYNRTLRARLGLPPLDPAYTTPPANTSHTLALAFAALPLPNGGMAIVGAHF